MFIRYSSITSRKKHFGGRALPGTLSWTKENGERKERRKEGKWKI